MELNIKSQIRSGSLTGVQLLVIMSQCLIGADVALMTVSLPGIGQQAHAGPGLLQWILSASFLTLGGFLVLAGRLVDLLGTRRLFVAGSAMFATGLLPGILTSFLFFIIAGRVLVGLGGACLNPATVGVIVSQFPEGTPRDKAFALFSLGQAFGFFGGLIIGGIIAAKLGWHAAFIFDFLIASTNVLLGLAFLPRTAALSSLRGLDLPGAFTVTIGMGLLVYALSSIGPLGLRSPQVVGSCVGSALILALFVMVELRSRHPLLSFAVFKEKNVTISIVLALLFNALSISVLVPILLYVQQIGHLAATSLGLLFLPPLAISLIGVRLVPRALQCFSSRVIVIVAFLPFLGLLLPVIAGSQAAAFPDLAFAFALFAVCCSTVGMTMGIITIFAEATGNAPPHQRGVVSAVMLATSQIGAAVGLAVCASTLAVHAAGTPDNFGLTFLVVVLVAAACALLCFGSFRYGPPRATMAHH